MRNKRIIQGICALTLGLTSTFSIAQSKTGTITCCSDIFYIEDVGASNQPGNEIYADEVYVATNSCRPNGGDVEITSDITINSGMTVLTEGSVFTTGMIVASGGCDESTANAYQANNPIQKLLVPNVVTPNGDGINDLYQINVNNAKYYLVRVWQQINNNMQVIYTNQGDVTCNWPVLWDGLAGVSSSGNQTTFAVDYAFSNCLGWDNNAEDNRVWVGVFKSMATSSNNSNNFEVKPIENVKWLKPEEQSMNISVFPNPSTGTFTLESNRIDESSQVSIMDIQGREINVSLDRSTPAEVTFSLQGHPKGVYLLRLTHENESHIERIVLQ